MVDVLVGKLALMYVRTDGDDSDSVVSRRLSRLASCGFGWESGAMKITFSTFAEAQRDHKINASNRTLGILLDVLDLTTRTG